MGESAETQVALPSLFGQFRFLPIFRHFDHPKKCERQPCDLSSTSHSNLNANRSLNFGETFDFICDKGYHLQGEIAGVVHTQITCMKRRELLQMPACELTRCMIPKINNGSYNPS